MEPTQRLWVQLQRNSCRDELALTGPFVPRHHRLHTQIHEHKDPPCMCINTHTFSPPLRAQGPTQRNQSRRSIFYSPFHVFTSAAWIRSDPPIVRGENRFKLNSSRHLQFRYINFERQIKCVFKLILNWKALMMWVASRLFFPSSCSCVSVLQGSFTWSGH